MDRLLDLPEEGELTAKLERRVLDFEIEGECAARWALHYEELISENLLRRVVDRVGRQFETLDQGRLQSELKRPAPAPADVLVVEVDGHPRRRAVEGSQGRRYVALVGGPSEFAPLLEEGARGRAHRHLAPRRARSDSSGTTPSSTP